MSRISRRDFLAEASLAAGAATLAGPLARPTHGAPRIASGTQMVGLGKSGIKTSLLGIGTGTHGVRRSSQQVKLGQAKFTRLIRHAIDRGVRYIDTADQYGSHIFVREALAGVSREDLFIQTKTRALHPQVAKVDIERFRQELGTDAIDSLLLHCMMKTSWPTDMRPVMDVLSEAKEKGRVRAVGISCHSLDALRASAGCAWVDIQLVRINAFGTLMDGSPEEVVPALEKMQAAGKGVIGMKLFGCGRHVKPQERRKSLKFVLRSGCVDSIVIGCESPREIDENLDMIAEVLR